jgi:hypothetical protein
MPKCNICGEKVEKLSKCETCGENFCFECGDLTSKICILCLEEAEEVDLNAQTPRIKFSV